MTKCFSAKYEQLLTASFTYACSNMTAEHIACTQLVRDIMKRYRDSEIEFKIVVLQLGPLSMYNSSDIMIQTDLSPEKRVETDSRVEKETFTLFERMQDQL